MRKIFLLILSLMISPTLYSQQASDYFPQELGHKWHFEVTPLDSLNNPILQETIYQIDSFAAVVTYEGKSAYEIFSKTGDYVGVQLAPYMDTSYASTEATNGFTYFKTSSFLGAVSTILPDTSLISLFKSFEKWYSVYRFASNVGTNYTIFSYDTTVTLDTVTVPLRFQFRGRRLADETINTDIGLFNCKKFLITGSISYLISFPPLPPIPVQILAVNDTVWIAPQKWIVQSITPSSTVDLSFLGLGSFTLPGVMEKSIDMVLPSSEENEFTISDFRLYENYPNPFNPETNIRFTVGGLEKSFVKLKVFDLLGNLIDILLEQEMTPGTYNLKFSSANLASGVYFYSLQTDKATITKKMNIIK